MDREPGARLSGAAATSLMVGAGVGAGVMAVPVLAEQVGLLGLAVILPVAWAASAVVHLMLLEVALRTDRDLQVVELMRRYVFHGRLGRPLLWLVFALLALAFLANLAAYVAGAGEILADLLGVDEAVVQLGVYVVSAGVVLFGLGAVGIAERVGALALFGLLAAILVGAIASGPGGEVALGRMAERLGPAGSAADWLALYAMVMYAYWTFYSVPQVVAGLGHDGPRAVRAVLRGLGLNGVVTAIVALTALAVSAEVTDVAIIGIADAIGPWAGTLGALFIVAALVTSYWSVSLALADILRERTGIPRGAAWLLATLPSLLVLWAGVGAFLEWLRLAGGATAIVVALITIPMYRTARRIGPVDPPSWDLGRLGRPPVLALALLAMALMAAGSLIRL